MMNKNLLIGLMALCFPLLCGAQEKVRVVPGDEQAERYLPLLQGRRVAVFSNHTAMVGDRHLVDVLVERGVEVAVIFSPEHGFRGKADAGEKVGNTTAPLYPPEGGASIPVISLYGNSETQKLKNSKTLFDVLVVDIQDVGLRFYTYYITMCRLMDACAAAGRKVVLLDRPNPNGHYVDGPILDMKHKSGVGWLPIPVVHGMTLGELARMVNGEGWLTGGRQCDLTVIPCLNYTHRTMYRLPIPPSPNLPNMKAVYLYPSLCLFEATPVSLGRGTDLPFQVYGHPDMKGYGYSFTPRSRSGAKNPPQKDRRCYGVNLSILSDEEIWAKGIDLGYLIDAYRNLNIGEKFFTPFFEKLIGVDYVRQMIVQGASAEEIRARWLPDVERFKQQRRPYLLYDI